MVAGLVEHGGTSAGHFAPVPGTGSIWRKTAEGWKVPGKVPGKVPKAPVHTWVIIRFLVPRGGGAVMLRCPRVFQYLHSLQENRMGQDRWLSIDDRSAGRYRLFLRYLAVGLFADAIMGIRGVSVDIGKCSMNNKNPGKDRFNLKIRKANQPSH